MKRKGIVYSENGKDSNWFKYALWWYLLQVIKKGSCFKRKISTTNQ
jgi:hypothetical protein